jgi:ribonuclease III
MTSLNETPFNLSNSLLQMKTIKTILFNHGIDNDPQDISIYRKALLHKSYCTRKNENFLSGNLACPVNCLPLQEESNERLEFLGDAVLNLVVADYLFERYVDVNEGFLTIMRTRLVNGKMLAFLARKLKLGKYIVISKQIESNNGRDNIKILEDSFEALIGAIYIDFNEYKINTIGKLSPLNSLGIGFQVVKLFIINVIETYVDFSELVNQKVNPKDKLIKSCQHNFQWTPKMLEMDITEIDNNKIHTICIKNPNGEIIATGKGKNRKSAEINASVKALDYFGWSES